MQVRGFPHGYGTAQTEITSDGTPTGGRLGKIPTKVVDSVMGQYKDERISSIRYFGSSPFESFDKNKGCMFEFDQEYVFVNLKHTRFHQQAGFQIIQKAHQPYDLQQISASSSNDENLKYDLQAAKLRIKSEKADA